jgi:hypothetical protein
MAMPDQHEAKKAERQILPHASSFATSRAMTRFMVGLVKILRRTG